MKRFNPLYVVLLFITILFVTFFVLSSKKQEYVSKTSEYKSIQQKAKEYKSLKSQWSDKKFTNDTIERIIKNRMFSKEKVLFANSGNVTRVKIESKDPKILDAFLNKVLNKPITIKNINMTKNSISLEIGVK